MDICRKNLWMVFISLFFYTGMALPAYSCACCADPAERHIGNIPLQDYLIADLKRLSFGPKAALYSNTCGLECVWGIENPQDLYQMSSHLSQGVWTLDMSSGDGPNGAISFDLPAEVFEFFVDTTPDIGIRATPLYKELRLSVRAQGTGIFATGLAGQPEAQLILQGAGNHCTAAEDFTHWQFRVKSKAASFVLYGSLAQPKR